MMPRDATARNTIRSVATDAITKTLIAGTLATILPWVTAENGPAHSQPHDWSPGENPDLWLYRARTVGMLKRCARLSVEVGRLPSLLGREFFRTHVPSYTVTTFEDTVIFVHDVENSLEKLDHFSQQLIARVVLLDYSHDEAADLLGCRRRTVGRLYPEAVDHLSEIFLHGGLLELIVDPESEPEDEDEGYVASTN